MEPKDGRMCNPTNPAKSPIGAWDLVSGSSVGEDQTVVDYTQAGIKSLKVLSERKFSNERLLIFAGW
jgi:hypothetical protein